MGSVNFTEAVWTNNSVRDAYLDVCSDRAHEYGNNGYNGTISTTVGFHAVTTTPMTESGASLYAHYTTNLDPDTPNSPTKGEVALAIPLADDDQFTRHTTTFSVSYAPDPSNEYTRFHDSKYMLTIAAYREAFTRHCPFEVHNIEVVPTVKYRFVTENAPGTAVTRYEVTDPSMRRVVGTFDTKAQANAAARDLLQGSHTDTAYVKAVKVYPMGESGFASVVRRKLASATARVTVTTAVPKAAMKTSGWLFYGLASS